MFYLLQVRQLFDRLTEMVWHCNYWQVYCKVSGNPRPAVATVDVTGQEFYGPGYDDSDKRIPDMTIIKRQLGKQFAKISACDFRTASVKSPPGEPKRVSTMDFFVNSWHGSDGFCGVIQSGSPRPPSTTWWSILWRTNIRPTLRQWRQQCPRLWPIRRQYSWSIFNTK